MTTKQSDLLATKPETKKALAVLQKFAEQEKANDIVKLEGEDWGYITRATRRTFKGSNNEFMKTVLDTTKVGAYVTLNDQLPEGVEQTETQYLTKRFK
jgi:hypothetical protein